jgi:hypothetical protein
MDAGDKLAAATLAAGRCVALGQQTVTQYFTQYEEFVRLFEARESAADAAEGQRHNAVWGKLGEE